MLINKTQLAKDGHISRSTLYYRSKLQDKDLKLKQKIKDLWKDKTYSSYGHRRLAIHLQTSKNRVLRVMHLFKLKPPKRRVSKPFKPEDLNSPEIKISNLTWNNELKQFIKFTKPNQVWAGDFTYIWFDNKFFYVATVIDIFTKEILGVSISDKHDTDLITKALNNALKTSNRKPEIFHSGQGSEYRSEAYQQLLTSLNIKLSYSKKSSPWQNAFQESFYNNFKLDLGNINQFESEGQLAEGIYETIYNYKHKRIHTTLKTTPKQFHNNYQLTKINEHLKLGTTV